ncbi:16S rRNA (cytidine(1402)-2'-O)-methyltransferase [Thermogemmatispora carboxidivorans]|uniref:16S rRNA (cytidine(1402)-2'-O)-methyltransferase n=1 Tax=Thermogemmatispora carboxidivorans TaxID=1382306 RepID=UPI00069C7EFC|nr:16S rRNA (cytidine(1402)-2'-O)-methyltransferase [Thermogemmatispora carboxidivorans]
MSTLYLVATPIGNLGDMTLRALEVLRSVDVIAAEDTRKTAILLRHYDIHKPLLAFYEHNEERAGRQIEALLKQGKSVALVTNAGTPGISDPGYTLVQRAIQAGIPVTMIPGPAAFVMALVLSGLPVHSFTFRGFPPRKAGRRRRFLEADRLSPYTLIYYESPYRLTDLLRDALEVFGDRPAALANELTKLFEKVYRGTLSSLLEMIAQEKPRGEYVLVVAGASREQAAANQEEDVTPAEPLSEEVDEPEIETEEG